MWFVKIIFRKISNYWRTHYTHNNIVFRYIFRTREIMSCACGKKFIISICFFLSNLFSFAFFLCLITERFEECVRRSNFSSSRTSRTTKKRRCCLLWFCIIFKTKKIVSTKKKYNILPFFHPLYKKKHIENLFVMVDI